MNLNKGYELRESWTSKTEDEIQYLAKSKAYQSFVENYVSPTTKANDRIPCLRVTGGDSFIIFYVDLSWHVDSIVQPDFGETLQNFVNPTLHHTH